MDGINLEYLHGVEAVQEQQVTQLKREYVAVLQKLIEAKDELRQTQALIVGATAVEAVINEPQ